MLHDFPCTRRELLVGGLQAAGSLGAASFVAPLAWGAAESPRPKVAVVCTEFRFRSHTYNILENFIKPYLFRGKLVDPGCDVVSMYADQFPADDMARRVSRDYQISLHDTIAGALCRGGDKLAVDAVLLIGEHGDYPDNELGQKMYPRKQFFDQIVATMERSQKFVPVFNDKHLSYRWDWSKQMYDLSRKHKFPLLAGSSVPLAERRPMLEFAPGADFEEAVVVHGGGLEVYDFHGLELLQSMVEARKGGETGVSRVELVSGDAYKAALRAGRWSQDLVDAAMQAEHAMQAVRQTRPQRLARSPAPEEQWPDHALLVTYKDGLRGTVVRTGRSSDRWNFACRVRGEQKPRACAWFNGPWGNRCLFKALSHAIQHLFIHREAPYPVERTLLVGGILDAAMHSHAAAGKAIATPELEFAYQASDFSKMREDGSSWKIITATTPQPDDFNPGDKTRAATGR